MARDRPGGDAGWQTTSQSTHTRLSALSDIERVLSDPSFTVAEGPAASSGIAWLRATASRFHNGAVHAQRRQLVEAELSNLDPRILRPGARERTSLLIDRAVGEIEVMSALARRVPLAVLSLGLGVTSGRIEAAVDAAIATGPAYLSALTHYRSARDLAGLVAKVPVSGHPSDVASKAGDRRY